MRTSSNTYTSAKASSTVKSNASAENFTFDISSALTSAKILPYSKIKKATITVWGDIDTATSRGKMTATFGSTTICSDVYAGGSAGEVSRSADITSYINSENYSAGKLKDSSTRLNITLDGPVMLAKFNHTASWQLYIEWEQFYCTVYAKVSPENGGEAGFFGDTTLKETETAKGNAVRLDASPNSGYKFIGWYKNGVLENSDNPYSVAILEDCTYTAVFEADKINRISVDTSQSAMVWADTVEASEVTADTTKVYG